MKRFVATLSLFTVLAAFAGCGGNSSTVSSGGVPSNSGKADEGTPTVKQGEEVKAGPSENMGGTAP
jgi:hypothetical protein